MHSDSADKEDPSYKSGGILIHYFWRVSETGYMGMSDDEAACSQILNGINN